MKWWHWVLLVVALLVVGFFLSRWIWPRKIEVTQIVRETVMVDKLVTRVVEKEVTRVVEQEVAHVAVSDPEVEPEVTITPTLNPDEQDEKLEALDEKPEATLIPTETVSMTVKTALSPSTEITSTLVETRPASYVVIGTGWLTNVPHLVAPAKGLLSEDKLYWSHVVRDPGVLGADDLTEVNANESAVWTGGANHQIPDQNQVWAIVPEAGYLTAYASGMFVKIGDVTLDFPNCGSNCGWGLLVRGSNTEHTAIEIENLGAGGGLIYTRYPVPRHAGEFFSERYLQDLANNFLVFDNCGIDGCESLMQAIYDINDGALTILRFTKVDGWKFLWTNVEAAP